jgi:hypothetical protein
MVSSQPQKSMKRKSILSFTYLNLTIKIKSINDRSIAKKLRGGRVRHCHPIVNLNLAGATPFYSKQNVGTRTDISQLAICDSTAGIVGQRHKSARFRI